MTLVGKRRFPGGKIEKMMAAHSLPQKGKPWKRSTTSGLRIISAYFPTLSVPTCRSRYRAVSAPVMPDRFN
jgi:hypothetical protein